MVGGRYGRRVHLLTTDWHEPWTTYEWWRDIGVGGITGAGSIAIAVAALAVSLYAVKLNRRAVDAQDTAERVRHEPRLRARWAVRPEDQRPSMLRNFENAFLLIDNSGGGTAYELSVSLGEAQGQEIWSVTEDAPKGWEGSFAARITEPGGTVSCRWTDYLGRPRVSSIQVPELDHNLVFLDERPAKG